MSVKIYINVIAVVLFFAANAFAQTSAFVYQGKLNDGGVAANGTYQFEFKLFDSAAANAGNQIGGTLSNVTATVTNGIFSVSLDFGASSFDGAARYLEIAVRLNGSGQNYTPLNPRQPITATPYAVKSLKANEATTALTANDSLKLGNVPAANYTQNDDARLNDARTPTPNSTYYIQNGASLQAASNFNISGTGKANILDATTQLNLGGNRFLSAAGTNNTIAGLQSGTNNAGTDDSFFGRFAGFNNTTGSHNAFFGSNAGLLNTTGGDNAFFGQAAGFKNTEGVQNTAAGSGAGLNNTSGNSNVFVGQLSGLSNTTETGNTFLGYRANGAAGITNATAIGANAVVTTSNTMVLGTNAVTVFAPGTLSGASINAAANYKIGGNRVFHLTGTDNTFAGFESGNSIAADGKFNAFFGSYAGKFTTSGFNNAFFGSYAGRANLTGNNNSFVGANAGISNTTGGLNSFFGSAAGFSNLSGAGNSFFGTQSGSNNESGQNNSFFGYKAGEATTAGSNNTFVGAQSGAASGNGTGSNNTAIGYNNKFGANVSNSVAIGTNLTVTGSHNILLGGANDYVQMGFASAAKLTTDNIDADKGIFNNSLTVNGPSTFTGSMAAASVSATGEIKSEIKVTAPAVTTNYLLANNGAQINGLATISSIKTQPLTSGGDGDFLCLDEDDFTTKYCYSDIGSRKNLQEFRGGLKFVNSLRTITFNLKDDNSPDVGLMMTGENTNPLFVSRNKNGEENVRYRQVIPALVSATQEQQTQISDLKERIAQQNAQIEALKTLVCSQNPTAAICQPEKK